MMKYCKRCEHRRTNVCDKCHEGDMWADTGAFMPWLVSILFFLFGLAGVTIGALVIFGDVTWLDSIFRIKG